MESPYSHHHFMFPFRWDSLPEGFQVTDIKENISFDQRTHLASMPNEMGKWRRKIFSFRDETDAFKPTNYNEFTYFHEFVSQAIYDFPYAWKRNQEVLKYYEYDIVENSRYIINIPENGKILRLILTLDGITLHLYNTGVGVLTFNLTNELESQSSPETILKINEFGRRIYPQFMGDNGNKACKGELLADSIELDIGEEPIVEDFSWYSIENIYLKPQVPYQFPRHITALFPPEFVFTIDFTLPAGKILITKITDDRMFFLSWYGNDELTGTIAEDFKTNGCLTNDWWYAHIFGDKAIRGSIANARMQKEHLENHSYGRWIGYGAIYGMSRDSFVCLTNNSGFARDHIRVHMQTIYYNLMVLCLAQRASILKFTSEVANLADLAKIEKDKKLIANIREIYKNYIEFINKLFFREVTPQIQGIELYCQIQKVMKIEKEISALDREIGELYQYVSLLQDSERNEEATRLNWLAMLFLPFTVVFGILGANIVSQSFIEKWQRGTWMALLAGCLISLFISGCIFLLYKLKKK